jgi:hypothetical protein
MFLPVPGTASLDRLAQQARAQQVFIDLLQRFTRENRNVSANPGRGYAPSAFVGEDEAKKANLRKADFKDAMRQLFQDQKIWNEPYGRASNQHYRLAILERCPLSIVHSGPSAVPSIPYTRGWT